MIVAEICSSRNYSKKYAMRRDLYDMLADRNDKFYFINCHFLVDKEKINVDIKNFENKKIFFFHPKSYEELNDFLKNNDIFLINNLSPKVYHLKIHLLISKKNIYQITLDNLGEMSSYKLENWEVVNLKKKFYYLYVKKLSFIFYRVLIFIRLLKPINKIFIARKDLEKKYKSRSNFFKSIFGQRYLKTQPIKPKFTLGQHTKSKDNKYIVFLDSNINHKDSIARGYVVTKRMQIDYLKKLKNYLIKIAKVSKKKAIICLHPSSNLDLYRKYINGIKIVKFKTEYYILKSFIVIFHDSSSVTSAFCLNKKIINLKSDHMGDYINKRSELYRNKVHLITHDLNNYDKKINENMIHTLQKNIKNHKKFMEKTFFLEKNYLHLNEAILNEIKVVKDNKFFNKD